MDTSTKTGSARVLLCTWALGGSGTEIINPCKGNETNSSFSLRRKLVCFENMHSMFMKMSSFSLWSASRDNLAPQWGANGVWPCFSLEEERTYQEDVRTRWCLHLVSWLYITPLPHSQTHRWLSGFGQDNGSFPTKDLIAMDITEGTLPEVNYLSLISQVIKRVNTGWVTVCIEGEDLYWYRAFVLMQGICQASVSPAWLLSREIIIRA